MSLEAAEHKYGKRPDGKPKVVFRDIASNTNERTCIAAVLPEGSCFGHTLSGIEATEHPGLVVTVLNSLVFDFALRLRTAGTHLSFTYVARMPVVNLSEDLAFQTLSGGAGAREHITEFQATWPDLWEVNRAVAQAYGLGPDQFDNVLSGFPVFTRKRPQFHAHLLQRLDEWKEAVAASRGFNYEGSRPPMRKVAEPGSSGKRKTS